MSSGSKPQTTTTTSEPPRYLLPYLQQGASEASSLYNQGGTPTVPFSPQTQTALNMIEQRAMSGSPVAQAAQNYATSTLTGGAGSNPAANLTNPTLGATNQFMGGVMNPYANVTNAQANVANPAVGGNNPYLDQTFNRAALATQNQLASQFGRSGRSASESAALRSEQLGNLANTVYGGAYENDASRRFAAGENQAGRQFQAGENLAGRQYQAGDSMLGRQQSAIEADLARRFAGGENQIGRQYDAYEAERARQQQLVPFSGQLASQDYADLGQLANVGASYEDLAREQVSQPSRSLDEYLARLQGFPGGTVTGIQPTERNRLAGALGGASAGSMFGPWGMLGGAVLGGLYG